MSLIAVGNKKTPVGSKISITGCLKGNLNMTHMGNLYFREGNRNPMTICVAHNAPFIFFKMLLRHDIRWQKTQHKWIYDQGHCSQ